MTVMETIKKYVEVLVEQHILIEAIHNAKNTSKELESKKVDELELSTKEKQVQSAHTYIADQEARSEELLGSAIILFDEFYNKLKSMSVDELVSLREELTNDLAPKREAMYKLEKYGPTEANKKLELYVAKSQIIINHINNFIFNKKVSCGEYKLAR